MLPEARPMGAERLLVCQDALSWLEGRQPQVGTSLVTSLPDRSEFPQLRLEQWESWFQQAATSVMKACPPQGVAIFYQTDLRDDEGWVDKSFLCQQAARTLGMRLLWHKVVCRVTPGCPSFGRPGYSHLLCFSWQWRLPLERSYADVLPLAGTASWQRGMGLEVCRFVCRFLQRQTETHTIIAPFCGQGLLLAVANELGLNAIGIERSPARARKAQNLQISDLKSPQMGLKLVKVGRKSGQSGASRDGDNEGG